MLLEDEIAANAAEIEGLLRQIEEAHKSACRPRIGIPVAPEDVRQTGGKGDN